MSTAVTTTTGVETASASDGCALPVGTRLGEFQVERVLGAGGFGIVYLALDLSLRRHVAIKEYVPSLLALRGAGTMLTLRSSTDAKTFAEGLRSFINEARLLASFDHPSLVKVHRFWEENGTAYMAMPYYAGRTLKDVRAAMNGPPDEAWMQRLIQPLLGALDVLHGQRVYHRDISPDNIMLLPDGQPLLLDFGSARRVVGDATQNLTAILKPHFAPIEQYADTASFPQGPWTDLYALGAVVYFMLTNELPMPAALRAMQDELPLLSAPDGTAPHAASSRFLAAIDWTLAVHPKQRPDSVLALRLALNGRVAAPAPSRKRGARSLIPVAASADGFWQQTVVDTSRPAETEGHKRAVSRVTHMTAGIAALVLCSAGLGAWALSQREAVVVLPPTASAVAAPPPMLSTALPAAAPAASIVVAAPPGAAPSSAVAALKPKPAGPLLAAAKPKSASPAVDARALEECADKNFLLKPMCIRRACDLPLLRQHPQCTQLRAQDEARLQEQLSR